MVKRDRHRQGIVYGPVRPPGRRDRGAIMGSILGLLVVVATVGLLGFGVLTFLQNRAAPPAGTRAPDVVATATTVGALSPAPTEPLATATPGPATPSPAVSVQPTTLLTPGPTVFVPDVLVGPGYVTFGTEADSRLLITDARTTFAPDERMVWSAQLTDVADSTELRIHVLKLDPDAPDGQRLLREDPVRPNARAAQLFLRNVRVASVTDGPGLYTVRYVRGTDILSEGSFLVPGG